MLQPILEFTTLDGLGYICISTQVVLFIVERAGVAPFKLAKLNKVFIATLKLT